MTFREWFEENLSEEASDIAAHGADAGWPHITYTADAVEIHDEHEDEIWAALYEDAVEYGDCDNVATFVGTFNRSNMCNQLDSFKNLLVWYMCEKVARELDEAE